MALEAQSLTRSVNMLVTFILYYYAGPGSLINCCKLCCSLSRASPEIAVVFLAESYNSVLERRYCVSCINFIELFVLPVCSFWHCKEISVLLTLMSVIIRQVLFKRPNILLALNTMRVTCESHDRLLEMVTPTA